MQLFKRMMLSLFPDEMVNNPMNPASIFVGFISAKQYFSVITRKIVENYKLNLFDIALDPFEVKIGFGDTPTIKVKDVDFYYGYAATANINGYRSYAPGQIAHAVTLVTSIHILDVVEEFEDVYGIQFLYTTYLLTFVFQAKCKVFPSQNVEENFSWFVELFFSLFTFLLEQAGRTPDPEVINAYKNKILKSHIEVMFMLYYFYQYTSKSLDIPHVHISQFYGWLLYDELKGGNIQPIAQDFLANAGQNSTLPYFTTTEKNLIHLLFPADILIRYLVENTDLKVTIRHMISHFYNKDKLHEYMKSFLQNDDKLYEFIHYISDYNHFKGSYFSAMKKYITHVFHKQDSYTTPSGQNEIDEWMSSIGEGGAIDMAHIPARLKQESETMERLMNFYITYVGGYWIGRGDSWYMRTFYADCIKDFMDHMKKNNMQDTYYYFNGILYSYSKNVFYYKYAFENIRAGKDKFHLPFRATFREVYSNNCIIKLFESSFITTILEDLLPKDIKIYIKNPTVVQYFATLFQKRIAGLVRKRNSDLLEMVYEIYDSFFVDTPFTEIIKKHFAKGDVTPLKENLYTPDFWIYMVTIEAIKPYVDIIHEKYGDISISGILASLRETILGFCMYYAYVSKKSSEKDIVSHVDELCKIYVSDVLNMSDEYMGIMIPILKNICTTYGELCDMLNDIDDNNGYLHVAWDNWHQYCFNKKTEEIFGGLSGEDIIWFRGFLKTITYYNKKFIMPQ